MHKDGIVHHEAVIAWNGEIVDELMGVWQDFQGRDFIPDDIALARRFQDGNVALDLQLDCGVHMNRHHIAELLDVDLQCATTNGLLRVRPIRAIATIDAALARHLE